MSFFRCLFLAATLLLSTDSFATPPPATAPLRGPWLGQREPGLRPEIFAPGLISTPGRREGGAAFSADGRSFFFTFGGADGTFATHVMRRQDDDAWNEPARASFANEGNTGETFISPSGGQLYFASSRPPGSPPWNNRIWVTEREGDDWGSPRHVDLGIATNTGVFFPTVSRSGILYVGSQAEKSGLPNLGKSDIYFADTKAAGKLVPQNIGAPINSPYEEWDPCIAPDESYLLFESDRPGGQGGIDIWVSFRQPDGRWGEPVNLGADVNGPGVDVAARMTPDGRFLFFERPSPTEQDIWWVSAEVIHRLKPAAPATKP